MGGNATEKIAEDFVAKSNLTNTYTLGRGTYFVTAVAVYVSQYSVSSYTFTLSTTGTIIYNAAGDPRTGRIYCDHIQYVSYCDGNVPRSTMDHQGRGGRYGHADL